MNCCDTRTNLVGPYRYSNFKSGSCVNTSGCGCSLCDVNLEFDYGTNSYVEVDWSKELKKKGACKIMSSKWLLNKTASVKLKFGEQSFSPTTSSIFISGGIYSGEYELINEITTERGETCLKTVCIKLTGSEYFNSEVIEAPSCEVIQEEDMCVPEGFVMQGTYSKSQFCNLPYCSIVFHLIEGSARILDTEYHELCVGMPASIESSDMSDLDNFFLVVDCNSKVMYELVPKE